VTKSPKFGQIMRNWPVVNGTASTVSGWTSISACGNTWPRNNWHVTKRSHSSFHSLWDWALSICDSQTERPQVRRRFWP